MMHVNSPHFLRMACHWFSENMKMPFRSTHNPSRHLSGITLFLVLALTLGCGAATRELEQVNTQQAKTETLIKAALIEHQSVNAASIQVTMNNEGAIVLNGFVGTQKESDTAERLARQSSTGISVINLLEIR